MLTCQQNGYTKAKRKWLETAEPSSGKEVRNTLPDDGAVALKVTSNDCDRKFKKPVLRIHVKKVMIEQL